MSWIEGNVDILSPLPETCAVPPNKKNVTSDPILEAKSTS